MKRLTPHQLVLAARAETAVNVLHQAGGLPDAQRLELLASVWRTLTAHSDEDSQPSGNTTKSRFEPAALLQPNLESPMNTLKSMQLIEAARQRLGRQLQALDALPAPTAKPGGVGHRVGTNAADDASAMLQACMSEHWGRAGDALAAMATASAAAGAAAVPAADVVDVEAREVPSASADATSASNAALAAQKE